MTRALLEDKVDFVRLFLQNGINIKEFLTREKLEQLYQSVCHLSIFWIKKVIITYVFLFLLHKMVL